VIAITPEERRLDSADFKYNLRSTRKYALAILDFFDRGRVHGPERQHPDAGHPNTRSTLFS